MPKSDKPEAAKIGWEILESGRPYSNPWIALRSDRLKIRDKGEVQYTYLQHPGGVLVVPVTREGNILLIRQYRYPVDDWCLEIPAGGMHGQGDPEKVARKELLEETGATCGQVQKVGQFYVSNSLMDEICHVMLAMETEPGPKQNLEAAEVIEMLPTPAGQALEMARDGRVSDGKSALALLMCEKILKEKGIV